MVSREEFDNFMKKAERYCNRGIFIRTHTLFNLSDLVNNLLKVDNDALYQLMKEIEEYNEPILTDSERDYLKAVIKPFKDRVNYIVKHSFLDEADKYLEINVSSIVKGAITEEIVFPYFIKGSKYVNMELNRKYTLKELGLED